MPEVLHVIIKKDYAASLMEHLQKEQAIEFVAEDTEDIPEWQKEAVRKTLQDVQQHPEQLQPWNIVKQKYKRS
jgi:flagellar motor switch protein FliG